MNTGRLLKIVHHKYVAICIIIFLKIHIAYKLNLKLYNRVILILQFYIGQTCCRAFENGIREHFNSAGNLVFGRSGISKGKNRFLGELFYFILSKDQ